MWYLGQVCNLIVSFPDLCHLSYFGSIAIFQGTQPYIARKSYIFVLCPPSGSAHEYRVNNDVSEYTLGAWFIILIVFDH